MAHELTQVNGQVSMAYVGETPWHGLGQKLEEGASLDIWAKQSGMDLKLKECPVETPDGIVVPGTKIIYRGDTMDGLAVVGQKYKLVQPIQVLNFFKRYVGTLGELETAGLLRNARTYWAMARMSGEFDIDGDVTRPYIMLMSTCDGTMPTQARLTSVRVVCNNTLSMAVAQGKPDVIFRHNREFDEAEIHAELEDKLTMFKAHGDMMRSLAKIKLNQKKASEFLAKIFDGVANPVEKEGEIVLSRPATNVLNLFNGEGIGSELKSSKGTAYGLLNAITEHYDWHYGKTQDGRLESAWFGDNAARKAKLAEQLLQAA